MVPLSRQPWDRGQEAQTRMGCPLGSVSSQSRSSCAAAPPARASREDRSQHRERTGGRHGDGDREVRELRCPQGATTIPLVVAEVDGRRTSGKVGARKSCTVSENAPAAVRERRPGSGVEATSSPGGVIASPNRGTLSQGWANARERNGYPPRVETECDRALEAGGARRVVAKSFKDVDRPRVRISIRVQRSQPRVRTDRITVIHQKGAASLGRVVALEREGPGGRREDAVACRIRLRQRGRRESDRGRCRHHSKSDGAGGPTGRTRVLHGIGFLLEDRNQFAQAAAAQPLTPKPRAGENDAPLFAVCQPTRHANSRRRINARRPVLRHVIGCSKLVCVG